MRNSTRSGGSVRLRVKVLALSAAVLIGGGVLPACSSGTDAADKPRVDTLSTLSPGAEATKGEGDKDPSADPAVEAKRPQLRLDTSDEERARLGDAYNACLEAQGVPMETERAASAGAKQASPVQGLGPEYDDEFDACLVKLPLQPPETAPDTNPQYADDFRAYVQCLQSRGMKVHVVPDTSVYPDGLTWTYDDDAGPESVEVPAQTEKECMMEAFDGKK
ncbi:hypothetical protein [Streptomyces sp. AS58]|uniref:hypothetical protein n=1 Tax=Streptomyces sp. AS58 TaxID=1519489 RepID=UPI00131C79B2|nr:hypothetical protein [Streptomyces sp. AS58]